MYIKAICMTGGQLGLPFGMAAVPLRVDAWLAGDGGRDTVRQCDDLLLIAQFFSACAETRYFRYWRA